MFKLVEYNKSTVENSISLTFNHKSLFKIKHKIKVCQKHLGLESREGQQEKKGKYYQDIHFFPAV